MTTEEFKKHVNFRPYGPEPERFSGDALGWTWRCCGGCSYMVVHEKPKSFRNASVTVEARCSANHGKLFNVSPVSICNIFKSVGDVSSS